MNHKLTAILVLAGLTLLFVFQNIATVEIQFLFWSMSMPRALMLFLILGIGILIGWFLRSFLRYRKNQQE